jgi:hypothetical protein
MNIIDNLKGSIKATLDAVTGHGAIVELETEGAPAPSATIEVKITVSATGRNVDFKSATIDLHGQDDLDESALETVREFLIDRDPHYSVEVHGPFHVAAEGKTYLHGSFQMPADMDPRRKWLARARVKHTGVDPRSKYLLME